MAERLLLLDCDGVIFDSNKLIDKYVQKIEYRACDKYCDTLNRLSRKYHDELHLLETERANDYTKEDRIRKAIAEIGKLRKEHFFIKDMVLEEVLPQYKNRIDYYKIFQLENTFHGVIDKISEIYETGIFDDIYIVSHYNSQTEAEAKLSFFYNYLPMVKVALVKFHTTDFSLLPDDSEANKTRERSNKICEFAKQTGITDFTYSSFVDDTSSIVEEARALNVKNCFFKSKKDSTVKILEEILALAIYESNIDINNDNRRK